MKVEKLLDHLTVLSVLTLIYFTISVNEWWAGIGWIGFFFFSAWAWPWYVDEKQADRDEKARVARLPDPPLI